MKTKDLKKFEDLNKFLSIIIVDDDPRYLTTMKLALQQEGYDNILTYSDSNIPINDLKNANILLSDYDLNNFNINKKKTEKNGIDLIKNAKYLFGDKIETILFTGEKKDFKNIEKEATNAKVSVVFQKPFQIGYIKLWINELGKRIWLQQILDYDPDEVIIRSETGTILYADEEKERIFGKDIIGKKCYEIFEKRDCDNKICDGCPGEIVINENKPIRREWEYITRGDINQHRIHQAKQYLDINVAPLKDKQGNNLGLIEISRDITLQKITDQTIHKMESADSFEKRIIIFKNVFGKLGFKRVRLYFPYGENSKRKFKLVHYSGHKENFEKIEFQIKKDIPTKLLLKYKKPILFKRDFINDDRNYELDKSNAELYWVGKNKIGNYKILKKDEWVDIPLFAGGILIGKVTLDRWKSEKDTPDHYDMGVLSEFGKLAGQVIENAKQKDIIKRKEETNKAILELSKEITDISKRHNLLENTLELIGKTLNVEMCSIFIFNEKNKNLEMKKRWLKISNNPIDLENYPPDSNYITMAAYLKDKPQIVNDFYEKVNSAKNDKSNDFINIKFVELYEKILNEPLRNCIFAPLIVGDHKIGLLRAMNKNRKDYFGEKKFDAYDIEAFELLAGQIAVANYNVLQYESLNDEREIAKKYQRKAEETLKEKEIYINQLGHELLSPITEIVYENNSLLNRYERDKSIKNDIAIVQLKDNLNTARYFKHILDDFEFGHTHIERNNYDIELVLKPQDVLLGVIQMFEKKAHAERQIEIRTNVADIPPISMDRNRIQQVFINLIKNAIQYSNEYSTININYKMTELDIDKTGIKKWHEIAFVNVGIGIPEKDKNAIFNLYFRCRNAINVRPSGTGIGLYLVKQIMKAHKGDCLIKRLNAPTEIAIYLPYKQPENK